MRSSLILPLLAALAVVVAPASLTLAHDEPAKKKDTSTKEPANEDDQQQDAAAKEAEQRYKVPEDADAEGLLKFIKDLQSFRPATADQFLEHRRRAPQAMEAAAKKLLEISEDKQSEPARIARGLLLGAQLQTLARAETEQQKKFYDELKNYLSSLEKLSTNELGLAVNTASILERTGNKELAIDAYQTFGNLFKSQKDEMLAKYGEKLLGAARRADLLGNEMQIQGTTLDGEPFDWESYRGKVVLVDFWATWCGPCIQELPNVKKNFDAYKDRGFDVVGISLDTDRKRLEQFVKERELPWVTLFEGGGWDNPVATYYGVMAIPTVILVDKEGKVVSLNARGPELGRQLQELLGPPSEAGSGGTE